MEERRMFIETVTRAYKEEFEKWVDLFHPFISTHVAEYEEFKRLYDVQFAEIRRISYTMSKKRDLEYFKWINGNIARMRRIIERFKEYNPELMNRL